MATDPQSGEEIIWQGRPQRADTPVSLRRAAWIAWLIGVVCTCFAVVSALALSVNPAALLFCGAWLTTLGFAMLHGPRWWQAAVSYTITRHHVIWQRGPLRRSIRRDQISYARIFWNREDASVGDLELVRAVPAGVLRRRLLIKLRGLATPDLVWSLVRDAASQSDSHGGDRCLSQRLERGERVLWSAQPMIGWRRFVPRGRRNWQLVAMALTLLVGLSKLVTVLSTNFFHLLEAGLAEQPLVLATLLLGELMMLGLLGTTAGYLLYAASIRPGRDLQQTRYLITNRRVLIQRGLEELHLDRTLIVDVIKAPRLSGPRDMFLILDGPQARALATGGAFGETERDQNLKPMFQEVMDADGASRILLPKRDPPSNDNGQLAA